MGMGMKALAVVGLLAAQPASAAKLWLNVNETWNIPYDEFVAVCDPSDGRCSGAVEGLFGRLDLSGFVWASRMEAIAYVAQETGIPIDLTGTVYREGALWHVECEAPAGLCPPEHSVWFDFVGGHRTREGGSSFSFQGVYRDHEYDFHPDGSWLTTLFGYNMGEGLSIFADYYVIPETGQSCQSISDEDECWNAYGYFVYETVTEPTGLALLWIGLAGIGLTKRRPR